MAYFLVFAILSMNIVGTGALRNETATALSPIVAKFTTDLTELAAIEKLLVNQNFNTEVNGVIKVLTDGNSRQPVLMDDNGDQQILVAELFAVRLAKGDVPAALSSKRLLKLDTAALFDAGKTEEEISQNIEKIFTELADLNGKVILYC